LTEPATASFDETFAEIRSIVHGAPSKDAFDGLTALLDKLGDEGVERLDPKYLDPVRKWPMEQRVFPWAWVERAVGGEPVAFADLCAYIEANHSDHLALLKSEHARHVRMLKLDCYGLQHELVPFGLDETPSRLERLDALHLVMTTPSTLAWLSDQPFLAELRELTLSESHTYQNLTWHERLEWAMHRESLEVLRIDGDCDVNTLTALLSESTATLRELHVMLTPMYPELDSLDFEERSLRPLLSLPALASLEHLSLDCHGKRFTGRLRDSAIDILARAQCAETLAHVSLKQHNLTESGVAGLQNLPKLVRLDVSGNDFDPEALIPPEGREEPAEVVHEECIPEEERSVLEEHLHRSTWQRLRAWGDHVEVEATAFYIYIVLFAGFAHGVIIAFLSSHPLPWWAPMVVAIPLIPLRLASWPALTQVSNWFDFDAGRVPRHERRGVRLRALRGALLALALYAVYFGVAAYFCVTLGLASRQFAWFEAVWWTIGPLCVLVSILIALFISDLMETWWGGRR